MGSSVAGNGGFRMMLAAADYGPTPTGLGLFDERTFFL